MEDRERFKDTRAARPKGLIQDPFLLGGSRMSSVPFVTLGFAFFFSFCKLWFGDSTGSAYLTADSASNASGTESAGTESGTDDGTETPDSRTYYSSAAQPLLV